MEFFNNLTTWLYNTTFYKEHMIKWAAPLNDASFDIALFLFVILLLVVPDIVDRVRNHIAHRRIVRKNLELEEQRVSEKLARKTETENNALLDQYMKFLLINQMQQTGMNVTFEQFRDAKNQKNNKVEDEHVRVTSEKETLVPKKKKMDLTSIIAAIPKPEIKIPEIKLPISKENSEVLPEKKDKPNEIKEDISKEPQIEDINSIELNKDDMLPETEMVDLEDDDIKAEVPEDIPDKINPVIESVVEPVSEKKLEDINKLLAQKAEEEDKEPVQLNQGDIDDFSLLMDKIKKSQAVAEHATELEVEKDAHVQQNIGVIDKQVNKAITADSEIKQQKLDTTENKELDVQKTAAIKQKEKEAAKLKKIQEKAAKRAAKGAK